MNNGEYFSKRNLFNIMNKIGSSDLQETYDDLNSRSMKDGESYDQVFEVDGKEHIIPMQAIKDYLEEKKNPSKGVIRESEINNKFSKLKNALRSPSFSPKENIKSNNESDPDYYWDKNYNYEYMNPQAEKDKVLGKIRK
jgi:hypothetical protein